MTQDSLYIPARVVTTAEIRCQQIQRILLSLQYMCMSWNEIKYQCNVTAQKMAARRSAAASRAPGSAFMFRRFFQLY